MHYEAKEVDTLQIKHQTILLNQRLDVRAECIQIRYKALLLQWHVSADV